MFTARCRREIGYSCYLGLITPVVIAPIYRAIVADICEDRPGRTIIEYEIWEGEAERR